MQFILLSLVFALNGIAGGGPCQDGNCLAADEAIHDRASEGFRLVVTSLRSKYRFGAPIRVELSTENHGEKTGEISHAGLLTTFRIDVLLPNGKPAPLTLDGVRISEIEASGIISKPLNPGEKATDVIPELNRIYDMSLSGKYQITVRRVVLRDGDNPREITVESNKLTLTIVDDEE